MHKKARRVVFLVLFLAAFLIGAPVAGAASAGVYYEILDYVQEMHISNPQEDVLYDGAINGLIDTLDDPYTEYMDPDELEEFSNSLQSTFVGVGIELEPGDSYPRVLRTIKDSPAERAGVKAGDTIIKVDGKDIAEEPLTEIIGKIRGQAGTIVRLTIRRDGTGDFDLELIRSSINLPTVQGELYDNGTGYIKIDVFGHDTADDFRDLLSDLINKGAKKLILDLRDNPGGYLQAAVDMTCNFIEEGRTVVSIVDNNNKRKSYYTDGSAIARGIPVAVLVNGGSASASEILSGALQDYKAAILIGEKTYGKGTVQTVIPLMDGGALKLTTARYLTPNNRVIDHAGLEPDMQVLIPELQLAAAKSILASPDKKTVVFEAGGKQALVNGSPVELSQAPVSQGDMYLPLRFVFEALGCRVDWQEYDFSIKVTGPQPEIIFYPWDPLLNINGVNYVSTSTLKLLNLKVAVDNGRITVEK